ncbi:hypothetical protein GCM10020256_42130 [Streptomyces thermocoprophilus]
MIIWQQLRRSAAPWVVLPAALFVYLYMQSAVSTVPSHYGIESGESTIYALATIAPAVAACAAWDSGRMRSVRPMLTTSSRSGWSLLLFVGAPPSPYWKLHFSYSLSSWHGSIPEYFPPVPGGPHWPT